MEIFVACDDQALALRIRAGLHQLGLECPASQVVSHDSALAVFAIPRPGLVSVVFFGSQRFSADELLMLQHLHAGGGERLKVVAVGSSFSPATILQAVRSGAVDCLDVENNFENELHNVLERIKTTPSNKDVGRLITIMGSVGGAGASVVATNLAVVLSQKDRGCCLLDFQLRGGDLATLLKCSPKHNLLSLASKADHLDRAMFEQSLINHDCGVHLLAGLEPFSDFRRINVELTRKIIHLARAAYPNVVIDVEDCIHPEQVRMLAEADWVVVLLRCDYVSLYHAKRYLNFLTASHISQANIMLVANRIGQPKEVPLKSMEDTLGMPIRCCIPNDPDSVNASINLGVPVMVSSPKSKVSTTIARLADLLLGIEPASNGSFVSRFLPLKGMVGSH